MNTQDYQKDIPVAMLLVCFLQFFNFNRFTPLPDSTENRDTAGELIIHWDEGQNKISLVYEAWASCNRHEKVS